MGAAGGLPYFSFNLFQPEKKAARGRACVVDLGPPTAPTQAQFLLLHHVLLPFLQFSYRRSLFIVRLPYTFCRPFANFHCMSFAFWLCTCCNRNALDALELKANSYAHAATLLIRPPALPAIWLSVTTIGLPNESRTSCNSLFPWPFAP